MASTPTTNFGLEKQGIGENTNDWGRRLNVVQDGVDDLFGKISSVNRGDINTDFTLTDTNYVANQTRAMKINITGLTTGIRTTVLPNKSRKYILENSTQNDMIFKSGTGTMTIPSRKTSYVVTTGSNGIEQAFDYLPALEVDSLSIGNRLTKEELPSDAVYSTTGVNESLPSAFGDVTAINPTRLPNNHHIDGAVVQMLHKETVELATLYNPGYTFRFNEANTVIYDIRMFVVQKSDGRIEPLDAYFWVDSSRQARKVKWWIDGGNIHLDQPRGGISTRLEADGSIGATLPGADWQVQIHIFGGRYN